ncbi:MAG: hypothetical protein RBR06_05930 [Desulfuromonadaceae bacterium]|nr:hypothetical protein [Desulfuromonadaceae bacterium]
MTKGTALAAVLAIIFCITGMATHVQADVAPFQLSLTPDIAIHSSTTRIDGVTLNIWGENPQRALALGIINGSSGTSSGVSLGLVANYSENYSGAKIAWFANYCSGRMSGVELAGFNHANELHGVQLGIINYAENVDKGLQIGLINVIKNNVYWFGGMPEQLAPMMLLVNWRY